MLFHAVKIHKFSVINHVSIFLKVVFKSGLLLESGLQIQYIKIMVLIKDIFKGGKKSSNIHRYEFYTIKHYKNKEHYAILEHDHLDIAAKFNP
jgi:hypothetical protein